MSNKSKQELQCDIGSIWNILTCAPPTTPGADPEEEKIKARNEYLRKKASKSSIISEEERLKEQMEADKAAAAKKQELENEFQAWLSSRSGKPSGASPQDVDLEDPKSAGSAYSRAELEKELEAARQQVRAQEEAYMRQQYELEAARQRAAAEAQAAAASRTAPEPTPERDSMTAKLAPSTEISAPSAASPAAAPISHGPSLTPDNERAEKFESLLAVQGIEVILHLPAKDGSVKSKKATVRCGLDTTRVVLDVPSKDRSKEPKQLKFHLYDIVLISKGKGSSIANLQGGNDKRIMRFTFTEKPELNMELDDETVRDAVVLGFMGLVTRRRDAGTGSVRSGRSRSSSRSSRWSSRSSSQGSDQGDFET